MQNLLADIRYALRQLRRSPGFTAVAVITLALGIGANTAIFSVIEAVLLRPLPYKNPGQLMILSDAKDSDTEGGDGGILYKDFEAWRSGNHTFQDIAAYYRNSGWSRVTLNGSEPESAQGAFVAANFFPVVGVPPLLGRWITPNDEGQRERVVVLSHALWVRKFGASADVIGKTLRIDGTNSQIIGVMPESFQLPARNAQFWAPITTNLHWGDPALSAIDPQHNRGFYLRWKAIGRLKPDASPAQAQAEIGSINARLQLSDPDPNREDAKVVPLRVNVSGNTRLVFSVLSGAVFLVLLIACINVANLVLARGVAREREMAMRTALGAGRWRLIRQLFTESALLALFSASLGVGLSVLGVRALVTFGPGDIPRLAEAGVNPWVLAFTVALSMFAAILFGLIPAWKISRSDPNESLKPGAKGTSATTSLRKTHGTLVVTEFALSVVLLIGAGLLIHSFLALEAVDPGFQPEHVLIVNVTAPWGTPPQQAHALYQAALDRVSTLPGVRAAGGIDRLFDMGPPFLLGLRAIEGRALEPKEKWTPLNWDTVSGDYFEAIGIPLLQGRFFSDQDGPNSPMVAVIDENMARRYWPGQNPVGQQIKGQDKRGSNDDWVTVIGVVGDLRNHGLDKQSTPHVYEWYRQAGDVSELIVRTTIAPNTFGATLRAAIREIDQSAILSSVTTMNQQLSEQLSPRRFQTSLLGLFACIALLLAGIGIYGVMQYSVTQRTPEIGIRIALGASRQDVVRMVVQQGLVLALAGMVTGLVGAILVTRVLSSLLYGIRATDPVTFAMVVVLLASLAFLGSYLPARRAARVDPMVALRYE